MGSSSGEVVDAGFGVEGKVGEGRGCRGMCGGQKSWGVGDGGGGAQE